MGEDLGDKIREKLQKDFAEFQTYLKDVTENFFAVEEKPDIGSTPKELILETDIFILYRYNGEAKKPVLIVTPMINGYYVLDLLPEISFIRYLCEQGYAPYLIRWKNLENYDKKITFDYYITQGIRKAVQLIHAREKQNLILIGHCLGGVQASTYLAYYQQSYVDRYVSMNSPYDFERMGEVSRLTSKEMIDIDKIVDTLGNVPAEYMNMAFQFINSGMRFKAMMGIFHFYTNKEMIRVYKSLLQWREDNIDMPGEFARKFIRDFFQLNKFFNETLSIHKKKVSLTSIKIPVLNIISTYDDIAPVAACRALGEKIAGVEELELPDGHLGILIMKPVLNIEHLPFWEKILSWMQKP